MPADDLAAEIERENHVHRLGNLTLLTLKLNSSVSSRPWLGPKGKLEALDQHDDNLLTRSVRREHQGGWDEAAVDTRTERMVDSLIRTWRVPEGHTGAIVHDAPRPPAREVSVRELVAAGLLEVGTELRSRSGGHVAVVTGEGRLRVGDVDNKSPSGAGYAVVRSGLHGWWFWMLTDGRTLHDLRSELRERLSNHEEGAS